MYATEFLYEQLVESVQERRRTTVCVISLYDKRVVSCINVTKRHVKNDNAQNSFIVFVQSYNNYPCIMNHRLLLFYYDGEQSSNEKNTEVRDG